MFEEATLIGILQDLRTSPELPPLPGNTAVPVQMRFVHAKVAPTVRPPENVDVWVSTSPSHARVDAVAGAAEEDPEIV